MALRSMEVDGHLALPGITYHILSVQCTTSHTQVMDMQKVQIITFFFENRLQWQFEVQLLLFTVCTCV